MVFERELEFPEAPSDLILDEAGSSSIHVETDVDVARDVLACDQARTRHDANLSHVSHTHGHGKWRGNQQVPNICHAVAGRGRAPYHHVEHFLLLEQAPHLEPIHQRRRGPSYTAGVYAVALGGDDIHLDL